MRIYLEENALEVLLMVLILKTADLNFFLIYLRLDGSFFSC